MAAGGDLGSLSISLLLETVQFTAATQKAAYQLNQQAGQMVGSLKGVEERLAGAAHAAEAFAAAFAIDKAAEFIASLIETQAHLQDLAVKAGTTASQMSALAPAAKLSGTSLDDVAVASAKFSKSLVEVQSGSGKGASAFKTLGLSAEDAAKFLADPAQGLFKFAQQLNTFADSGAKTAAVMAILGKSGEQLLPFLKQLGQQGALAATVSDDQAKAAHDLEDAYKQLGLRGDELKNQLAAALVPALASVLQAFVDVTSGPGGLGDAIKKLTDDGSIATWAIEIAKDLAIVAESIGIVLRGFSALFSSGKVIVSDINVNAARQAVQAANESGDPELMEAANASLKQALDKRNSTLADANAQYATLLHGHLTTLSDSLAREQETIKLHTDFLKNQTAEQIAFEKQMEGSALGDAPQRGLRDVPDTTPKAISDAQKFINALKEQIATLGLSEEALNRYKAAQLGVSTSAAPLIEKLATAEGRLKSDKIAADDLSKAWAANDAAMKQLDDEANKFIESLQKQDDALKLQNATFGLSSIEQQRYVLNQQLAAAAAAGNTDAVRILTDSLSQLDQIAGKTDIADAAKRAQQAWEDTAHDIERALEDSFFNAFKKGQSFGEGLRDALEEMFKKLVLRPLLQPIAGDLSSLLSGGPQGGGGILQSLGLGGGGAGGIGSFFGNGSSLFGTGGALTGLFGGGGAAAAGGFAAASETYAAGTAALTSSLSGVAAAAIPVIGWIAAAGALIYSLAQSNKEPTPVSGQIGINSGTTGFEDNAFTQSKFFGNVGFQDQGTQQFSGAAGAALTQTIVGILDLIGARETDAQRTQTKSDLQSTTFTGLTGDFTTEDFLKQYGSQELKEVVGVALGDLDPLLAKALDGFKGVDDALPAFIGGLLTLHDITTQLPAEIGGSLESALDGTQATLDSITTLAAGILVVQTEIAANPLADAMHAIALANADAFTSFTDQATALRGQIDAFDGSTAAVTSLTAATQSYYAAQVQLLAQIEQTKTAITGMFADTTRNLTLQTLDDPAKYTFYQNDAEQARALIEQTSDPDTIRALAARVNDDIEAAFGLLSPDQQRAQLGAFTDNIATFTDEVNARLNSIETDVQTSAGDTLSEAAGKLNDAADKMGKAADTDLEASQNNLVASTTPAPVVVVHVESGDVNG